MGSNSLAAALPVDRRQSATARLIARGTSRLLHALGCCIISELALPSGRRADLVALDADGTVWIVEIKSSAADLRADTKWMEYRRHCDRLFFATSIDMRRDIFPDSAGLIVADAFDAEIICEAPEHPLPAAARRSVMLSFARAAALRLSAIHDPEGAHL
ncbi:MAG TPA: MmcB family DNA repair protein [Xanthobacteraceae bacterium]